MENTNISDYKDNNDDSKVLCHRYTTVISLEVIYIQFWLLYNTFYLNTDKILVIIRKLKC